MSYGACALVFSVFSCAVSNLGLDAILDFSALLLGAMYPVAIVLVAMGMLRRLCDRVPAVWPWTVGVTAVVSVLEVARDALAPGAALPLDVLPLADVGLGWVVPALLAAVLSAGVSLFASRSIR